MNERRLSARLISFSGLAVLATLALGGLVAYRMLRPIDHAAEGYTALRAGDAPRALAELKIAVAERPDWAENHYNLGIAYENVGWTDQALPELEKAHALEPGNDVYRRGLAQTKRTLGYRAQKEQRWADAIKLYQGVNSLVGDDAATWYNLALVLQKVSRNDEAKKAIDRANELDPSHELKLPPGG